MRTTLLSPSFCVLILAIGSQSFAANEAQIPAALVKVIDQADVPAREAGVLLSVEVQEGARVEAGAALAKIDDTEAQFALRKAQLDADIARKESTNDVAIQAGAAALRVAEEELRRAKETNARVVNAVSSTELDRLQLNVDQAKFAIAKAEHEFALAKLTLQAREVEAEFAARNVERRVIAAPFDGMVVQVNARKGEWVEPGNKLLRLIRLDHLRAEGMIEAKLATPDLAGRSVELTVELPGGKQAKYNGRVSFVSPEIDPFTKQVRVLADIENSDLSLRPGLRGALRIGQPIVVGRSQ